MKLIEYIKETKGELKHVSWPTRKQALMYTVTIIVVSVVTAAFLGFFDYLFSLLLGKII
ncbi:MAG TPA: preprotein translocase subunit SecE [Candidatus Paceibacterota bacterium]